MLGFILDKNSKDVCNMHPVEKQEKVFPALKNIISYTILNVYCTCISFLDRSFVRNSSSCS